MPRVVFRLKSFSCNQQFMHLLSGTCKSVMVKGSEPFSPKRALTPFCLSCWDIQVWKARDDIGTMRADLGA